MPSAECRVCYRLKGGAPRENLGSLKAFAFDKTGTLTEGRSCITDTMAVDGASAEDLLALAVAVEALSDHPLTQTIVKDGAPTWARPYERYGS